jgi:hypothetical protein
VVFPNDSIQAANLSRIVAVSLHKKDHSIGSPSPMLDRRALMLWRYWALASASVTAPHMQVSDVEKEKAPETPRALSLLPIEDRAAGW